MSLLGPIDNRELTRWQLDAARALVEMLSAARRANIPVIRWSLSGSMMLVGQVSRMDRDRDGDEYRAGDGLEVRDVFQKWCDFIGVHFTEHKLSGRVHLRGEGRAPGNGRITVVILAEYDPEGSNR